MLNLVLGVGVFSLLPNRCTETSFALLFPTETCIFLQKYVFCSYRNMHFLQKNDFSCRKRWFLGATKIRGCRNGAFGKRSFCLGDTCHLNLIFVIFVDFGGLMSRILFLVGRMHYRNFADFRQNHLFSAGDKNTVFQNDRFDNPEKSDDSKLFFWQLWMWSWLCRPRLLELGCTTM